MNHQFCTFRVADYLYGVDVLDVQEVISLQPMTRLPLGPSEIRGLINLRGQIVAAIDMRRRFGLPPAAPERAPVNVVVRVDDNAVSLLADTIGDVVEIDEADTSPIPETVPPEVRAMLRNIYKFDRELLHVIDVRHAAGVAPEMGAAR